MTAWGDTFISTRNNELMNFMEVNKLFVVVYHFNFTQLQLHSGPATYCAPPLDAENWGIFLALSIHECIALPSYCACQLPRNT